MNHLSPRTRTAWELRALADTTRASALEARNRAKDTPNTALADLDREIARRLSEIAALAAEGADAIDAAIEQRPKAHRPSARRST